jgi:hypothetical protein
VIFESLYGICDFGYLSSVSAEITLPSAERDWLIFFDSSNLYPVAPVTRTLSLPARSTKFSLPTLALLPSGASSIYSTVMMKTAWLRDEVSFIFVLAVTLLALPLRIS